MLSLVIRFGIAVYRLAVSPILHLFFGPGFGCRFQPTCSQYMEQSVQKFGFWKGLGLSLGRLSRCHPFAEAGYDPIPHDIGKPHNPHPHQGR